MPHYADFADDELVRLTRADDRAAFAAIYDRHWEELLHCAYRVIRDKDICMDILHDVFVWYWEHRKGIEVRSIKAYLLIAVKHQVANFIRRSKVHQNYIEKTEWAGMEQSYDDNSLEVKEFKAIITQFTMDLPDRCRTIYQLSRNEHLSNKEIASKLGISEKTVEMQITIALKRLRLHLGKYSSFFCFFL